MVRRTALPTIHHLLIYSLGIYDSGALGVAVSAESVRPDDTRTTHSSSEDTLLQHPFDGGPGAVERLDVGLNLS
jgi:hypothetical protein